MISQDDLNRFDWTSVDAVELRAFLKTQTGLKLLRTIAMEEPTLLSKGETNEILIRSGEVAQHKHLTSFLLHLTGDSFEHQDDEEKPQPAYPSLENDAAWDGPKLNEPE